MAGKGLALSVALVLMVSLSAVSERPAPAPGLKGGGIRDQWLASPHAKSMDTPEERERMNTTGCAHCHTAQGYWEVILGGEESTAPYEDVEGITCWACHYPMEDPGSPSLLRAGDVKNACNSCHGIVAITNDIEHFSFCPQGAIVEGKGGALFADRTYPTSGAHSRLEKRCVSCHMAPDATGTGLVGEHTFVVITKDSLRVFNAAGCEACHGEITIEFVERSEERTRKLLGKLAGMLPKRQRNVKHPDEMTPRFPKDPELSEVEAKAAFNYYFILRDGTYGVHNPLYIRALLTESIESLKKADTEPPE